MDKEIWQGRLSPLCTWRHCPLKLCCWVFSLRLAISSLRLICSDKLDLIHRLLSSIYFATGLCHPIDIRTEWWYQISYSGYKSSERIEMLCDLRRDILQQYGLWTQCCTTYIQTFCSSWSGLFSSYMWFVSSDYFLSC